MAASAWGCVPTPMSGPSVVAVYPSADRIPENVLRFYVSFSAPMREGDFLDHVRLERVDTKEDLTGVFFDNIHELWSSDRRRITLLVDPGRVKTGLRANLEMGRAFEAGGTYRLRVLETWTSTRGEPLLSEYSHTFQAIAEDSAPVAPDRWCLIPPAAGSPEPLQVDFGEPVDHVSVHRLLRILDPEDTPLSGTWTLGPAERTAAWTPDAPWGAPIGAHTLLISGRFEDVAGNNLNAAFEHRPQAVPEGRESTVMRVPLQRRCAPDEAR